MRDEPFWRPGEGREEAQALEAADEDFEGKEEEEEEEREEEAGEAGETREGHKVPFAALSSITSAADRSLPYTRFLGGMTVNPECSANNKLSLESVKLLKVAGLKSRLLVSFMPSRYNISVSTTGYLMAPVQLEILDRNTRETGV